MVCKDCGRNDCAFEFVCVVSKKPKDPKLSSMADDAITLGGIRGLGSLVYICGDGLFVKFASKTQLYHRLISSHLLTSGQDAGRTY